MPQQDSRKKSTTLALAGGVIIIMALTWLRFSGDAKAHLPALPPRPAQKVKADVIRGTDYNPDMYSAYLAKDSARFGIPVTGMATISQPFPYDIVAEAQELSPGKKEVETQDLRITARVEKVEIEANRGSITTEHLILRIQNKTNRHVVYRVVTTPSIPASNCMLKGNFELNAIGVPPKGFVDRTECTYRKGMVVTVESIETMQVPELSYYYLGRIFPRDLGLDPRTTAGHRPDKGEMCEHTNQQAIRLAFEKGAVTWRDVVDFYARHRCETYIFPVGYKAIGAVGQYELPVAEDEVR